MMLKLDMLNPIRHLILMGLTCHKLSILSSIAFGCDVQKIKNEGIQNINLLDLKIADTLGYKIKLLGLTEFDNNNLSVLFILVCFQRFIYCQDRWCL